MKAYITKYALTDGILEVKAEEFDTTGMITWMGEGMYRTRVEAINQAEAMRSKKIESLKKQIEKLEKLRFN